MNTAFRIPTIVGFFLLLFFVGMFIFLFENLSRSFTSAGGSIEPRNLVITNVTDSSFTVTWQTLSPATGVVLITEPQLPDATYYDDRDTQGHLGSYVTHSITVRTILRANSSIYSFKILSHGKTYENHALYQVQTAPALPDNPKGNEPAYGTVMAADNKPAVGAIVYVALDDGQLLSALVSSSGSWLVALNLARTKDLTQYVRQADRLPESIKVVWNTDETSALTDTLNDSPVPLMILGKTYDFRKLQGKANGTLTQNSSGNPQATVLGSETQISPPTIKSSAVTLTAPAEGAFLPTFTPLVEGTGVPGERVSIVLGINKPLGGSAIVGSDGIWRYTPAAALGIGKQSVTITTVNEQNKPVALTHSFTILKSGTQVLGEATPSATLEPSPTASITAQPIPTSGTTLPTLLIILIGFGFFISGIAIFAL